jgi:hypothetical protein
LDVRARLDGKRLLGTLRLWSRRTKEEFGVVGHREVCRVDRPGPVLAAVKITVKISQVSPASVPKLTHPFLRDRTPTARNSYGPHSPQSVMDGRRGDVTFPSPNHNDAGPPVPLRRCG